MNCEVCNRYAQLDRCHIKSRKSGGPDADFNIYLACRVCHNLQHLKGHAYMCEKHPKYEALLKAKGWEINQVFGRFVLTHPLLLTGS